MQRFMTSVLLLGIVGCGAQKPESPPAEASAGAEQEPLTEASLSGLWVEFWAVSGHADTQRYAFFPDGRFGWRAASSDERAIARRFGRASVQSDGKELVLGIDGQAARGCESSACAERLPEPIEERLVIGACPPNEEARALDANYRCVSLGGQAFWRHAHEAPEPSQFLLE